MSETVHAEREPEEDAADLNGKAKDRRPIWEILAERARNHPPEELDKIPHDGALNHDHYLYGFPKKNWDE